MQKYKITDETKIDEIRHEIYVMFKENICY